MAMSIFLIITAVGLSANYKNIQVLLQGNGMDDDDDTSPWKDTGSLPLFYFQLFSMSSECFPLNGHSHPSSAATVWPS